MLTNELAPVTAITSAQNPQLGNNCQGFSQPDYTSVRALQLLAHDAGVMPTISPSGYTYAVCPLCGRAGKFTICGTQWVCECQKPVFGSFADYLVLTRRASSRRDALTWAVM